MPHVTFSPVTKHKLFKGKFVKTIHCILACLFLARFCAGTSNSMDDELANLGFHVEDHDSAPPNVFLEDRKLTVSMSKLLTSKIGEVKLLMLRNVTIERDALSVFLSSTQCRSVFVSNAKVDDANQWLAIRHQKGIESIDLDEVRLPDEFEKVLHQLPSLREFFSRNCGNFSLNSSWTGNADIEKIWIENSSVGDEFLRSISSLRSLRRLDLSGAGLTDRSIALFGPILKLESLSLSDNQITKLPPDLQKSELLQIVYTFNTSISLDELRKLTALPKLKTLGASWDGMSEFEEEAINFIPRESYEQRQLIPDLRQHKCELDVDFSARRIFLRFDKATGVDSTMDDFESLGYVTRHFCFRDSDLSDIGLARLLSGYDGDLARAIHSVDIMGTKVTESGFRMLLEMGESLQEVAYSGDLKDESLAALVKSDIQAITLRETPIAESLVQTFLKMKNLNSLSLDHCQITQEQRALLEKSVKKVVIH